MDKKLNAALVKKLEKHRDRIGKERDALNAIRDEISALTDTCEEGLVNLQSAIDHFSGQA